MVTPCPCLVRGLLIPQESALALVLINNAVIDSPCGKQSVPMRCEGDTSWEEAPNPLQDTWVPQSPLGSLCDNKKRALKEGIRILTVQPHIWRGEQSPGLQEMGFWGKPECRKRRRWHEDTATLLGRWEVAGVGSKTPGKTTIEKQPLAKG